jgi:DNA primase
MDAKEEIRSRLNIEDVIGDYVQLKRAGRNFKGLSPFSGEKTPSFVVSPDKHIWHDFSSNKGGDVFSFIMEVEGLDFRGTLELLARKAGVDLSLYQAQGDKGLSQKKERLYQALALAVKFYQQNLVANQAALQYVFAKRQFSKEIVQRFGIGYAPNLSSGLTDILIKRCFTSEELHGAGLSVERRGKLGDMFRGRMVVPLCDAQGRVVGFTARLIDDQPGAPKYINTPQTLIYDKGRQVFGLHMAKEAIRRNNYAVVMEGNLDVVASHQAGETAAVATAGTSITEWHLRSLSRLTNDIRLCFDVDRAGIAATERAIGMSSQAGIQLQIIKLPEGYKDPDELIRQDPTEWQRVVQQPQDAMEWLLDYYSAQYDLSKAEGKRQVTSKALDIVGQLVDPVAKEHYVQMVALRTGASVSAIGTKLQQMTEPLDLVKIKPSKAQITQTPKLHLYQDHLLALAWVYPQLRDSLLKLEFNDFEGTTRQAVYGLIHKLDTRQLEANQVDGLQSDRLRVKIKELELIVEQRYATLDDSLYFVAAELSKRVLVDKKTKQKDELARELSDMQDPIQRKTKNKAYKKLIQEIESLKH